MDKKDMKYKGFWRYMNKYLKDYYPRLLIAVLCSVIVGATVSLQPLVIKYIVDEGITNQKLANIDKIKYIGIMCIIYASLCATRIIMWRVGYYFKAKAIEGALFNLRSNFFYHVQNMCMKFYEKTSVGELFNCIMGTPIINIKSYIMVLFSNVPYQFISLVISVIALANYDYILTMILLVMTGLISLFNYLSKRKVRKLFSDYIKVETEASHYLNDILQGMDAVRIYSIEGKTFETFKYFIANMYKKGVKANFKQTLETAKPELVRDLGTAVVYMVGAISCIYRGLSVGTLYAFLSSMGIILETLVSWSGIGLQKSAAEAGLHKIIDVINDNDLTLNINEGRLRSVQVEKEKSMKKNKPCISFRNVTFSYNERDILKNLSCDIKYNESVALVGASGSGKSTFTKLAMRLYDVNDGEVFVHGCNVSDYNLHELRVTFGVVPQNPYIFYGSIWDNVCISRPDATNLEIMNAMELAHVHEFVNNLPDGWNTMIGEGGLGLSGGQKQRIAIARAVLGNPDILIFDEATSALDNVSERHIQQAMEELMTRHTIIIVAHRLSSIKNVDRIMVFDEGKIVEEGSYDELSKKDGEFKKLLDAQI